jgi:hypothetical protein
MKQHQRTIDRAIEHIKSQQSLEGIFVSLSSFSPDDFSSAVPRQTTFFTANILACIQNIPEQTADIRDAGIKFLLSQKSKQWSFNYWARGAPERTTLPYPDDLDDTFAALAAIARHNGALIDGHAFSAIAKILTMREIKEGGPYRTWLVADDAQASWQDVDSIANSTIGYFLSLVGVRLPRLEKFLDEIVRRHQLTSPYYPDVFPSIYFLSRFYKNCSVASTTSVTRAALADIVIERLRDGISTLQYAMAISSLVNLGYAENFVFDTVADLLVARLEREGFLPYAFCIDPARDSKRCYAGASALTAAFCAEALALAQSHDATSHRVRHGARPTPTLHNHIRSLARTACQTLDPDLRAMALAQIEKTSDEKITTLAYEFHEALYKKGVYISLGVVEPLSLANLFGWMAYDSYDAALDGEDDAARIPCANFFLRTLTEIYHSLSARTAGIIPLFKTTMNRIDNANAWEQRHCRIFVVGSNATPSFGDHQTLADRSIGHAMGPLAILLLAGYPAESEEYKNVESFFRHYLIARQLHDDAHDWTEDLLRGRVNSVSAIVLNRFKEKYFDGSDKIMTALPQLKKIFWEEAIDVGARMIIAHVAAARRAREKSPLVDTDFMESALQRLASGARRAVTERDETLVFLKNYRGSPPSGATGQK